jgi:hypothetical protein
MHPQLPLPPLTPAPDLVAQLQRSGWAVLEAASVCASADASRAQLMAWQPHWAALPPDPHLRDGGRYRRRRHGCFVADGAQLQSVPHRAHWQPVEYNALHGGYERWFDPLPETLVQDPTWSRLILSLARVADALRGPQSWYVEAHPFRINTEGGIGRPTPEGAHRDGVDLVAVLLIDRHNIKGGETRVFDALGPQGVRFTLHEAFSVLLLDDARVIHETTPIQPQDPDQAAWRDTLVLTWRAGGFQGPQQA